MASCPCNPIGVAPSAHMRTPWRKGVPWKWQGGGITERQPSPGIRLPHNQCRTLLTYVLSGGAGPELPIARSLQTRSKGGKRMSQAFLDYFSHRSLGHLRQFAHRQIKTVRKFQGN